MKIHPSVKNSFYSAITFFGTVIILSVWYAALTGGLSTADKVWSGSGLTSASWNRIVDGVLDLDSRISNFSFSGGNVGIGAVNPGVKLDVNGDIRLSWYLYPTTPIHFQVQISPGTGTVKYPDGTLLPFWRGIDNFWNSWNTTTHLFTAPTKGMYEFCISALAWNDSGTANSIYIAPPWTPWSWIVAVGMYHSSMSWEDNFKCRQAILNAGQVEWAYVWGGWLNIATSDYTYISGRLLYAMP